MIKKLFPLLGILAATAAVSFAQTTAQKGPNATRLSSLESELARYIEAALDDEDKSNGITRPRVVEKPAAAVKSFVTANTKAFSRTAFEMVNRVRVENGLGPLAWNDELAAAADLHSQNMAEFQFFSHKGLDSKMVSDRADAAGVGKWRSIGENIAYNKGYNDPVALTVQLWLDSPSHRRNMLSADWKESAIGVAVTEEGAYYFTQVFLVRK